MIDKSKKLAISEDAFYNGLKSILPENKIDECLSIGIINEIRVGATILNLVREYV